MNTVFVRAVGIAAPGLPDWQSACRVLRGEMAYVHAELPAYQPALLPPNERRRATPAVRQAFRAAEDALAGYPDAPAQLAAVFASSDADLGIIHRISLALTETTRAVSPTDFHNSVHNAAAGYWSIATQSRMPSNTVCAYDSSFAAGLLEAATMVATDARDTLLVAYDVPAPPLLHSKRPFSGAASVALILSARRTLPASVGLRLTLGSAAEETRLDDAALETLRLGNPAARALPLLRSLARGDETSIVLTLPGRRALRIERPSP